MKTLNDTVKLDDFLKLRSKFYMKCGPIIRHTVLTKRRALILYTNKVVANRLDLSF